MKVLFVCTGNTCRSAMAQYLAEGVEAQSAGVAAGLGAPMSAGAIKALGGLGSEHKSRPVTEELVRWADVVVGMTRAHVDALTKLYPAHQKKFRTLKDTDIQDPIGESDAVYAQTAAEIKEAVHEFLAKPRP